MNLIVEVDLAEAIDLGAQVVPTDLPQQAVVVLGEVGVQVEVDLEVADIPLSPIVQAIKKQKEI